MSTAEQMFIADLRRVLYLSQVYRDALKFMRDGELCKVTRLHIPINNVLSAIQRLFLEMRAKTTPETFDAVMRELNSDELKDISLLIDFAASINNVGEVVEVLQEHLKPKDI